MSRCRSRSPLRPAVRPTCGEGDQRGRRNPSQVPSVLDQLWMERRSKESGSRGDQGSSMGHQWSSMGHQGQKAAPGRSRTPLPKESKAVPPAPSIPTSPAPVRCEPPPKAMSRCRSRSPLRPAVRPTCSEGDQCGGRNPSQVPSVLDQLWMERRSKESGSRGDQGSSRGHQGSSMGHQGQKAAPGRSRTPLSKESKAVPPAPSIPTSPAPVRCEPPPKASFTSLYSVGKLLGQGTYGCVYEGTRRADGQKVALKYIVKRPGDHYMAISGTARLLPREVALMKMASQPPCSQHVLQLLDWYDFPRQIVLVLERPDPCMDLAKFSKGLENGRLPESLAKTILRQTVLATRHCHDRGVLHRDIKGQNILINTDTFDVKLIDFGFDDLLKETPYRGFAGTGEYNPPEWVQDKQYLGRPATVWQLGVLLFHMVCGKSPFRTYDETVAGQLNFTPGLSQSCKDLIRWCLATYPHNRPDLEQILKHNWCLDSSP